MPIRRGVPFAFQAMPIPDRLAFRIGGAIGVDPRTLRCRAFSKPAAEPSATAPAFPRRVVLRTFRSGSGRSDSVSQGNVIRSAPGESNPAVYGDLPLRVYKAQPHASADAEACHVARRAGNDPASPVRQTGRFT